MFWQIPSRFLANSGVRIGGQLASPSLAAAASPGVQRALIHLLREIRVVPGNRPAYMLVEKDLPLLNFTRRNSSYHNQVLLRLQAAAAAAAGGETMRPPEKHSCFSPAEV